MEEFKNTNVFTQRGRRVSVTDSFGYGELAKMLDEDFDLQKTSWDIQDTGDQVETGMDR